MLPRYGVSLVRYDNDLRGTSNVYREIINGQIGYQMSMSCILSVSLSVLLRRTYYLGIAECLGITIEGIRIAELEIIVVSVGNFEVFKLSDIIVKTSF